VNVLSNTEPRTPFRVAAEHATMYDAILVPTDGSDATDAALDHALDHARTYGATLHVLYVVDDTGVPMDVTTVTLQEALVEHGEAAVETVAGRVEAADVPVVSAVVRGTPHREILDYVDEHDVNLVVMATHGRSGIDRYLLGSVTEKVVRLSDAPVLTVRVDEERANE
jgi:nucleotide-binding universal stress UspA family protein